LSILIVDDAAMREINRDYLGKDRPTNVISFAMQEGEGAGVSPQLLGDVVISADTAARDAAEAGQSFVGELYFLLLHGMLHLRGYDHERGTPAQEREMERLEQELFSVIRREFLT
jgi:probable rRNA maturation factor